MTGHEHASLNKGAQATGHISLEEAFAPLLNLRLDTQGEVAIKGWRYLGVMNLPAIWGA